MDVIRSQIISKGLLQVSIAFSIHIYVKRRASLASLSHSAINEMLKDCDIVIAERRCHIRIMFHIIVEIIDRAILFALISCHSSNKSILGPGACTAFFITILNKMLVVRCKIIPICSPQIRVLILVGINIKVLASLTALFHSILDKMTQNGNIVHTISDCHVAVMADIVVIIVNGSVIGSSIKRSYRVHDPSFTAYSNTSLVLTMFNKVLIIGFQIISKSSAQIYILVLVGIDVKVFTGLTAFRHSIFYKMPQCAQRIIPVQGLYIRIGRNIIIEIVHRSIVCHTVQTGNVWIVNSDESCPLTTFCFSIHKIVVIVAGQIISKSRPQIVILILIGIDIKLLAAATPFTHPINEKMNKSISFVITTTSRVDVRICIHIVIRIKNRGNIVCIRVPFNLTDLRIIEVPFYTVTVLCYTVIYSLSICRKRRKDLNITGIPRRGIDCHTNPNSLVI